MSALRTRAATGISGAARPRGGDENTMRKIFALAMVALLALTIALAAIGCGKKAEETTPSSETTTPPAETSMDTTMKTDTSMHADTSMHQ